MQKRGYHDFSFKIFCRRVPKTFVEESFCVSENFWYRKMLGIREGGWNHDFPSKLVCLTVPKKFVGEAFCVPEIFCYGKNLWIRDGGGGYHDFPSKNFCFTVPKNFVGETFNVSQNFEYRKILCIRRGFHYFLLKPFFVSQCRKTSWGNHSRFQKKFRYRKFSCIGEGCITVLSKKVLSHRTETKDLVTEPSCFPENFWYRKKFMGKRRGWLSRSCPVKS